MPSKKLNPEYVEAVKQAFLQVPYFQLLGMTMQDFYEGGSEFLIPAQHKHLNPHNGVHGGVIASILDATCYWAAYSQMPTENAITTVEMKINYLSPGREGNNLRSKGQVVKAGRSLGVAEAKVFEEESGRLVGFGTATVMALNNPLGGVLADLPPKFLTE